METTTTPANTEQGRGVGWLVAGLFVLGCVAIVLTTTEFIASWFRNPEQLDRSAAGRFGLFAAVAFGVIRLVARGRLMPTGNHARLLYRLQGQAVFWTSLLMLSISSVGGNIVFLYLVVLGAVTMFNRATAWEDYGAGPRKKSGWQVKCLAVVAAFLWVMSAFESSPLTKDSGAGFMMMDIQPPPYTVALFWAVWCCLAGVIRSTPSSQLYSLKAAGCGLLAYLAWYYESWMFWRWYYDSSDKYFTGLLDGTAWDGALLLVLVTLFSVQLWRLWPVIRARLHA